MRFSIKDNLIRANQGHSFPVDLKLKEMSPPSTLYHGTHEKVKEKILEKGILRMNRHHVHLTDNILTAKQVGGRRGKPLVLEVDAAKMHESGFLFYLSANNVWLTKRVPPEFVKIFTEF